MIVEVVGAVIRDEAGRVLTVRKRGAVRFILPGGKRESGEDDLAALTRELREELGVDLAAAERLGRFEAVAANEPGACVRSAPTSLKSQARSRWPPRSTPSCGSIPHSPLQSRSPPCS